MKLIIQTSKLSEVSFDTYDYKYNLIDIFTYQPLVMLKYVLTLLLITIIACNNVDDRIEYVEIFTVNEADSITHNNKGLSIDRFLHLDYTNDSVFILINDSAYWGEIKSEIFVDSIKKYIKFVNQKVPDRSYTQYNDELKKVFDYVEDNRGTYCGPPGIHINIQKNGIKESYILYDGGEHFKMLHKLLDNQSMYRIEKRNGFPFEFNGEHTAIEFYKRVGMYDQLPIPYLPQKCDDNSFYANALYGQWRYIMPDGRLNSPDRYNTVIYLNNGRLYSLNFLNKKSTLIYRGDFKLDTDKKILLVDSKKEIFKIKIKTLNDSCLVLESNEGDEYYNRY